MACNALAIVKDGVEGMWKEL